MSDLNIDHDLLVRDRFVLLFNFVTRKKEKMFHYIPLMCFCNLD